MKQVDLVRRVVPTLEWTLCIVCFVVVVVVIVCQANPIPSASKHDAAATLVVTNDGTHFHNTSPPNTNTRGPTVRNESKRQGKQRTALVDLSQLGFREDTSNYPEEEIKRLLRKTPDAVKELFNVVNTELDPHMNLTERTAFYNDSEESGDGVREESVCRTVTRNIYPREATRKNSLVYVPNNQEFMQVIQAEICQHPDRECSYLRDALPYGMTSVCYQKYAYKKLLYLDATDKHMASDLFRYPSCCVCFVRSLPFDVRSNGNSILTTPASRPLKSTEDTRQPPAEPQNSGPEIQSFAATTTPESNSPAGRSRIESQRVQGPRTSRQMKPSNQTVILSSSKVFESNK